MCANLRFPMGQFQAELTPNPEQLIEWINEISEMPTVLRSVVQSLNEEQLLTTYRIGGWTIQQLVHHMADNDMNAFIRFKKALTEDQPTANSYREDLWAELNDSINTPIETSLTLLEALHSRFVLLLRSLSKSDFQRTFLSPTHGKMSLDLATQRFAWHGRHHIAQIESLKCRMGW
jgi:hypothetical protein